MSSTVMPALRWDLNEVELGSKPIFIQQVGEISAEIAVEVRLREA
jgi:hypothetical protein